MSFIAKFIQILKNLKKSHFKNFYDEQAKIRGEATLFGRSDTSLCLNSLMSERLKGGGEQHHMTRRTE
jgi:hypothetical protein